MMGADPATRLHGSTRPALRRPFITVGGRSHRRLMTDLPAALEAMTRSLRTGATLRLAMAEATERAPAGQLKQTLVEVLLIADRGRSLHVALADAAGRSRRSPELAATLVSLATIAGGDGAPAQAVDRCARAVRGQIALRRDVKSMIAQAELSMWILVLLPVGFMAVTSMSAGPNGTTAALFRTDFGRLCLGLGLALDLAGLAWMRTMLRRVCS